MKRKIVNLIIIASLAVFLSGCTSESSEKLPKPTPTESSAIFKLYYPLEKSFIPTESHVNRWESYMREKHLLQIDLNYLPLLSKSSAGIDIEELMEVSKANGFVYIERYEDLTELIKNGSIVKVNYCVNSLLSTYEKISPRCFDGLTDSMGDLWAFPVMGDNLTISKRTYNKTWLDEAGMPIPENLEDFLNFAKYVAYEDPDGNGIKDTYVMEYSKYQILHSFMDIFRAFGCYPEKSNPTAYNPLKQGYENVILSENFIDAMTFIKTLSDEGLIIQSDVYGRAPYKVASSYTGTLPYDYVEERAYGYFLKGPNETMLIEEEFPERCIVALKNTDDVYEKINRFYKMVFGSPESSIDLYIGIEGEDYIDQGNFYEYRYNPYKGINNNIIRIISDFQSNEPDYKPAIYYDGDISLSRIKELSALQSEENDANEGVKEYSETQLLYRIDFSTFNFEVNEIIQFDYQSDQMFADILNLNSPIEEAVQKYRDHFEQLVISDKLNEINHR